MSPEMFLELWELSCNYIQKKDRLDAARAYVHLIDDFNLDQASLEEIKDSDHYLEAALNDLYEEEDVDRYDDDNEEW